MPWKIIYAFDLLCVSPTASNFSFVNKWGYNHSWHLHTPLLTWKNEVQICHIRVPHIFGSMRSRLWHQMSRLGIFTTKSPQYQDIRNEALERTYIKGPSGQSEAICKRRGRSLGFPSVRNSCFPVCPTTKGAIGTAISSKSGNPRRNGSCGSSSTVISKTCLLGALRQKCYNWLNKYHQNWNSRTPHRMMYLILPPHAQMRASKCYEVDRNQARHLGFLVTLQPRTLLALPLWFSKQDNIFNQIDLRCIQCCNCIPCKEAPEWVGYKWYPCQAWSPIYNLLNLHNKKGW